MSGELRFGEEDGGFMANQNFSFCWQPGIVDAVRKQHPDVMVCDGFFKWTFPALAIRAANGTPLVVNYERTRHTERHAQAIRTLYRRMAVKLVDAMNCSGSLCKEYTMDLGMSEERITTGHMSADTDGLERAVSNIGKEKRLELRERLGVRGVMFLYVGRMDHRKAVEEMVGAWRSARIARQEASLVLVGDGDRRPYVEREISEARMDNVHVVGKLPYEKLPLFYAAADAFIIATREDNWSLVVPEAMACELPILCSKYNGCWPELVKPGKNGWVFDPLRPEEFAATIRAAIDANAALPAMGRRSAQIVRDHGPDHAAQSILDACCIAMDYSHSHRGRG
jgi:glycosyltransferase involved in cell wall biosynthesis